MYQERTFIEKVNLFLKGLTMGGANKIPGVSGGMVAFVLGFYEELIYTFQRLNLKALKLLVNGRFRSFSRYTNLEFLVLVMTGSMFSYFSISLILDYFLHHFEIYVWACFFGMVIGSIYYISKDFGNWKPVNVLALLIGISIGLIISFMTPAKENDNLWFVFLCGIIGVSGMTLPGLSGSFILILLGNYVLLLVDSVNVLGNVVSSIFLGNYDFINDTIKIRYLKIIGVFSAGSLFGLISISHILGYVLKKWRQIVTALIIGFIAGSLGNLWPWKRIIYKKEDILYLLDKKGNKIVEYYERYIPNIEEAETLLSIGFVFLGITIILIIDFYGRKRK